MATSYNDILEVLDKRAQEAYSIYETCPLDELQIPIENSATKNQDYLIDILENQILKSKQAIENKKCFYGWSICRLCDCNNGSEEYTIDNFIIPSGYIHYLKVHNVKMDERLEEYVTYYPNGMKASKKTYIGYWKPIEYFQLRKPILLDENQDYTYKPIEIEPKKQINEIFKCLEDTTRQNYDLMLKLQKQQETMPFPIENSRTSDHDFLTSKLQVLINTIDKKNVIQYKGMSKCRICDKFNGSKEYRIANFCIPEGYIHYLQDHNVGMDERLREYLLYEKMYPEIINIGYWREKPKQEQCDQYGEVYSTISYEN